ncbi:MerR family transcriptional regulator [Nonomuraea sp. NN258]|uniref:MerR family transcriptional regulator n=1 Tax=Nonomuraea antri TaxID=2730852 RepID=UPI00156A2087|nr:MerR family transcriptional regulator [Nonomuraea antri]NRQ40577.1 MerR family transcriptional regulator [Nonomuraea antri]
MSELSIGQVAERTGLSVHTLRFYEREGLLTQPVRRGTAGHRVYSEGDVDWLGVCIRLRASGMPLTDIRRYTELVRAGQGNEVDRLEVLREHRERVLAQMDELSECLKLITHKVAIYEGQLGLREHVPDCKP